MAKILLKKVSPKTNSGQQKRAIKVWSSVILEVYSPGQNIPIVKARGYGSTEGKLEISPVGKKR